MMQKWFREVLATQLGDKVASGCSDREEDEE